MKKKRIKRKKSKTKLEIKLKNLEEEVRKILMQKKAVSLKEPRETLLKQSSIFDIFLSKSLF